MVCFEALHSYSLFGGLLPEDICRIQHLLTLEQYAAGSRLVCAGASHNRIAFLLEGSAAIVRDEIQINALHEGDFFGEIELLDVMPAVADVYAETDVKLLIISNRALREIYKQDTKVFALFMMNLGRELSRRLRRMDEIHCKQLACAASA